ncbi:hypothetical protein F5148DRAFT_957993, partial [Russula earlei]
YTDPYAVPALPHLDPNQLFRDDPYRGAVLQMFNQAIMGEVIPMMQLASGHLPGAGLAYSGDLGGCASPGQHMKMPVPVCAA